MNLENTEVFMQERNGSKIVIDIWKSASGTVTFTATAYVDNAEVAGADGDDIGGALAVLNDKISYYLNEEK